MPDAPPAHIDPPTNEPAAVGRDGQHTPAWAAYHQAMSDAVARLQQTITGLERRLAAMEARR